MDTAIPTGREVAALLLAVTVLAGCATTAPDPAPAPAAGAGGAATDAVAPPAAEATGAAEPLAESSVIPLWETGPRPADGLAGLAVWPGAGQRPWLLVAARVSHRLVLFDAASGELLREFGALGQRPGSFREPVDVAVAGDLAFVVERGNARVQVLRLPGLATVGFLGEGELVRPAAVAIEPIAEGWAVWVAEEGLGVGPGSPPEVELTLRRFDLLADTISRRAAPALFAEAPEVERLVALGRDPALGRMVVAIAGPGEEVTAGEATRQLEGDPSLSLIAGPVAGVALVECAAGTAQGAWIVSLATGGLLVFDRPLERALARVAIEGLATVGALTVASVRHGEPPAGVLYAVTPAGGIVAVDAAGLTAAAAACS